MSGAGLDDIQYFDNERAGLPLARGSIASSRPETAPAQDHSTNGDSVERRRTPRRTLIVVLPEHHTVSSEDVAERLPTTGDHESVDVIVACAGQPANLSAITRKIRDVQVLLAPAGTTAEQLRSMAISQASGDIVILLGGAAGTAPRREGETLLGLK